MINDLYNFAQAHTVAAMAAVHLAHLAWGKAKQSWTGLKAVFFYCRANGGASGIAKQFLCGKTTTAAATGQPLQPKN